MEVAEVDVSFQILNLVQHQVISKPCSQNALKVMWRKYFEK